MRASLHTQASGYFRAKAQLSLSGGYVFLLREPGANVHTSFIIKSREGEGNAVMVEQATAGKTENLFRTNALMDVFRDMI